MEYGYNVQSLEIVFRVNNEIPLVCLHFRLPKKPKQKSSFSEKEWKENTSSSRKTSVSNMNPEQKHLLLSHSIFNAAHFFKFM